MDVTASKSANVTLRFCSSIISFKSSIKTPSSVANENSVAAWTIPEGFKATALLWVRVSENFLSSISIINPGKTNTKMRKQAMPGENSNNLQKPKEVAEKIKH